MLNKLATNTQIHTVWQGGMGADTHTLALARKHSYAVWPSAVLISPVGSSAHFCYQDFSCQQVGRLNLNLRHRQGRTPPSLWRA